MNSKLITVSQYGYITVVLLQVASLIFEKYVWFFYTLSHLQLQFLVAGVTLYIISFFGSTTRWRFFAGAYILLLGGYVFFYLHGTNDTATKESPIVYFQNVRYGTDATQSTVMASRIARTQQAQIYAFVEPNRHFLTEFTEIFGTPPILYNIQGGKSCAVYASALFNVQNAYIVRDTQSDPICVVHFARFTLYVVHPLPPLSPQATSRQIQYFARLRALLVRDIQAGRDVLVVGDFNATLYSATFRSFFGDFLTHQRNTWMAGTPLALPLDHAFATFPVEVDMWSAMASDHRALILHTVHM